MIKKIGYFIFLAIGAGIITALAFQLFTFSKDNQKSSLSAVLNAKSSISTTNTLSPTPTIKKLLKNSYVVAAFGDSMIDTMEHMEKLNGALKEKYPGVIFKLYNYGIGATNVEQGLDRWGLIFSNRERSYPPITSIHPDIIILGSYAYNPFNPHDPNKRQQLLTQLIKKAKETGVKVYLLSEIAPLYDGFGEGPKGPNLGTESAHLQAERINEQLEQNAQIAKSENVELVDIFSLTQVNGKYGNRNYTNPDDGIHPSEYAQELTAEQIVKIIKFD